MASIKQRLAVKKTIENRGNVSRAMIEAGYSKNTAHNPKTLTESKGWKELMNEALPDALLLKVHKQGLKAMRAKGDKPDYKVRHSYLETGYKIKGKIKEGETHINATQNNFQINLTPERIAELKAIRAEGEE